MLRVQEFTHTHTHVLTHVAPDTGVWAQRQTPPAAAASIAIAFMKQVQNRKSTCHSEQRGQPGPPRLCPVSASPVQGTAVRVSGLCALQIRTKEALGTLGPLLDPLPTRPWGVAVRSWHALLPVSISPMWQAELGLEVTREMTRDVSHGFWLEH